MQQACQEFGNDFKPVDVQNLNFIVAEINQTFNQPAPSAVLSEVVCENESERSQNNQNGKNIVPFQILFSDNINHQNNIFFVLTENQKIIIMLLLIRSLPKARLNQTVLPIQYMNLIINQLNQS